MTVDKTEVSSHAHLDIARESLEFLLKDKSVPEQIRRSLQQDYAQIQIMLEKLRQEHIHIAVLGRVSVGKSSLLNVLMGKRKFSVSPLHGETREPQLGDWTQYHSDQVFLIDTPGINELEGQAREKMALEVASRADIILFVLDGDITETEFQVLQTVRAGIQPVVVVLNKADHYTQKECEQLLQKLRQRLAKWIQADNIVCATSQPTIKYYVHLDEQGNEQEFTREQPPDVSHVKDRLKTILEKEGKTLAAINAVLFADRLSDQVNSRLLSIQSEAADKLIHTYALGKGIAVALNPLPVVDLFAAAMMDTGLIYHLSRLYGLPISRRESGQLVKAIMSQILLLMGSIWLVHFLSSALKLGTAGVSTLVSASAQGAVAYYGSYVVGQAGKYYFRHGKSWGPKGPKSSIKKILDSIDRDSLLKQARADILARIKQQGTTRK